MRIRGERALPEVEAPETRQQQTEREIVAYAANQRQRKVEPIRNRVAESKMGAFDLTPSPIMRASDSDLEAIQASIIADHANGQYRGLKPFPGYDEAAMMQRIRRQPENERFPKILPPNLQPVVSGGRPPLSRLNPRYSQSQSM